MNPQVRWLLLVVLLDITGIGMVAPLLPQIARRMGLSQITFGIVGSMYGLAQMFSQPVMGAISDARGRKGVFIISLVGAMLAYFVMGAAATYNSAILLAASRVTVGLVKQTMTIAISFITDETTTEERTGALATLFAITNFGFIIGAPIGGVMSAKYDLVYPVLGSCGLYGLALAILTLTVEDKGGSLGLKQVCPSLAARGLRPSEYRNKAAPHALPDGADEDVEAKPIVQSVVEEFRGLVEDMLKNELILKIAVASLLATLSVVTVQTSFTMITAEKFGLSAKESSYMVSYSALVNAAWLFGITERVEKFLRRNFRSDLIFPVAALLSGAALVVQARATTLKTVAVAVVFGSLGDAVFKVYLSSLFTRLYEAEIGAAQGLFGNIESVCRVLAPTLTGFLIEYGGISMPWTFAGALNIIVAAYCSTSFTEDDMASGEQGERKAAASLEDELQAQEEEEKTAAEKKND